MFRRPSREPDSIDVVEAARLVEAGELLLVDVRAPDEWRRGRAPDARHIPLATIPGAAGTLVGHNTPIAFICRSGQRSAAACATARALGIAALNCRGGMIAWERAGLPTTRG